MRSNVALKPNVEDLEALDRAYVFHPSTHLKNHAHGGAPCRIVRGGEGVYVVDRDGRESLDAFAGLYCVTVGYARHAARRLLGFAPPLTLSKSEADRVAAIAKAAVEAVASSLR